MALFDNVLGIVQPPDDPNEDFLIKSSIIPLPGNPLDVPTNGKELEYVPLPDDTGVYELEEVPDFPTDGDDGNVLDFGIDRPPIDTGTHEPLDESLIMEPIDPDTHVLNTDVVVPPIDSDVITLDDTTIVIPPVEPTLILPSLEDLINAPKDNQDITLDDSFKGVPLDTETQVKLQSDDAGKLTDGIWQSPKGSWSNSLADKLFTGLDHILNIVGIPMPDSIKNIYTMVNRIEGYIDDPRMLLEEAKSKALGWLFPKQQDASWDHIKGIMMIPKAGKGNMPGVNELDALIEDYMAGKEWVEDEDKTMAQKLERVRKDIKDSQLAFRGRKSAVGMTMRMTHLWDVKVERMSYGGRTFVPPMGTYGSAYYQKVNDEGETTNNAHQYSSTEQYKVATIRDKKGKIIVQGDPSRKDFEDSMPVLSYDLDFMSLQSKEVELYGGASIAVPEILRKSPTLSMQVMDDENKRWRRWFQRYTEMMYDQVNNVARPYKPCCVTITIYQYRTDFAVLSHKVYIALLKNYQVLSTGSGGGSGNADILDIEWSIVGEFAVTPKFNEKDIA